MPKDDFAHHAVGLDSPLVRSAAVVPSDSAELPFLPREILVQATGNLAVEWPDGAQETHNAVPALTRLPWRIAKVLATGTTATVRIYA